MCQNEIIIACVTPRVTKTLKKVINKWLGVVTTLNQKVHFKNKVSDLNYREINPKFFFKWNSKFWSFCGKNLFLLAIWCNKDLARKISSSSETPRNFSKLYSNSTHRTFAKFSFEFHFKSGQVPMGKDVPCLELFPSIFYLKFLEPARPSFASN
jgi:hypothetical protein